MYIQSENVLKSDVSVVLTQEFYPKSGWFDSHIQFGLVESDLSLMASHLVPIYQGQGDARGNQSVDMSSNM